jgi:hypothetical protein
MTEYGILKVYTPPGETVIVEVVLSNAPAAAAKLAVRSQVMGPGLVTVWAHVEPVQPAALMPVGNVKV